MSKLLRCAGSVISLAVLAACGGGGGDLSAPSQLALENGPATTTTTTAPETARAAETAPVAETKPSGPQATASVVSSTQVSAPEIPVASHSRMWLQAGNPNDAYLITDDRWGAGGLTEGVLSSQYEQYVGRSTQVGANGEVAFRTKWRWPQGTTEVKSFPSIVYGRKPGHYSTNNTISGYPVQLPDGSISQASPAGHSAGTILPLQMPLQSLKAKVHFQHNTAPTGKGQLTFDIWLQSDARQDSGFQSSSITHEIMIPLANWGGYGAHNGGRNPTWFDHTATIGGKQYHIYVTKGSDGCLRSNFGSLNGTYGRTGWKMIAFLPAVLPVEPGEIDLAAIINYVSTRKDACGTPWAAGNEYVSSVELGVEPEVGTGDITVFNYKVSK